MRRKWETKDKIKMAKKAGSLAGGLAVGASKASVSLFTNTRGLFYRQKDFEALFDEMQSQAREYQQLTQRLNEARLSEDKKKELLMDSLGLASGSFLSRLLSWHVPSDLQQDYELAYPDKAAAMSLHEAAAKMDEEQLMGFTNGIKGKLFELRYTDYLNDGHLPAGYHAELANSATQPGWDIAILDDAGRMDEALQLKATESADYIEHAFERYPYINIVSTDEVYSQVTMGDMADHLINSGISNEELTDYVHSHVLAMSDTGHEFFLPSLIPYAIIAYSVARKKEMSDYKKGKEFGRRSLISYVCHTLGIAVGAFTHTWWLVPVTSVGLRLAHHYGNKKYEAYQSLKKYVKTNRHVLKKYRKIIADFDL